VVALNINNHATDAIINFWVQQSLVSIQWEITKLITIERGKQLLVAFTHKQQTGRK